MTDHDIVIRFNLRTNKSHVLDMQEIVFQFSIWSLSGVEWNQFETSIAKKKITTSLKIDK